MNSYEVYTKNSDDPVHIKAEEAVIISSDTVMADDVFIGFDDEITKLILVD